MIQYYCLRGNVMKKIGIIFALKEELDETKKLFNKIIEHKLYELIIYECRYESVICYLVESGMGKVNAARTTQVLIDNMKVDYILNVGVAGSVSRSINGKYINCDKKLIEIARKIKMDANVVIGTISSGDIFITEEKMGSKINNKFNALCVEMEGAAIAQVCFLCNIPFLVIRAISDSPYEKDNNITFEEFLKISSDMVSKFIIQFLNKMN